jgi:hypothetical protein
MMICVLTSCDSCVQGLQDLVVLFKCPDVHEARPEVETVDSAAGAFAAGNAPTAAAAAAPAGSAGSTGSGSSSGLSGWLSRTTSALRRPGARGIASMLCKALSSSSSSPGQAVQQQQQVEQEAVAAAAAVEESRLISVVCEEWVLQLLDTGESCCSLNCVVHLCFCSSHALYVRHAHSFNFACAVGKR